jgi:poly-beta-1,6-N-acetyl-D-glucosamine synthase
LTGCVCRASKYVLVKTFGMANMSYPAKTQCVAYHLQSCVAMAYDSLLVLYLLFAALVAHAYVVYPIAIAVLARLRRKNLAMAPAAYPSVSIVIAAMNEEMSIAARLEELTSHIKLNNLVGEVVVVSDGSTDRTAEIVRLFAERDVRLIELPENVGKATALTQGCAAAHNEILVFADARQHWSPDVLPVLISNFSDPAVGAVSGDLELESSPGVLAGVGLYWRFEKWLRRQESRLHSTVGVTGAISAVRRTLFRPIPARTVLDDVYWPLQVIMQGYRVLHDERAQALDRLPSKARDEFRRKVRTLAGNYQLLARSPRALFPWRNPIWFQYLSHKVCRLVVPWALLGLLITSVYLDNIAIRVGLVLQATFYAVGLVGIVAGQRLRSRLVSAVASFVLLNVAAWLAFWVWLIRPPDSFWKKARYARPVEQPAEVFL